MSITKDRALELVLAALASANEELDASEQVKVASDTQLFGADAQINSLTLVSLIVDVEQAIDDETGQSISLTDEATMNRDPSPFRNADTLSDYIVELSNAGD